MHNILCSLLCIHLLDLKVIIPLLLLVEMMVALVQYIFCGSMCFAFSIVLLFPLTGCCRINKVVILHLLHSMHQIGCARLAACSMNGTYLMQIEL